MFRLTDSNSYYYYTRCVFFVTVVDIRSVPEKRESSKEHSHKQTNVSKNNNMRTFFFRSRLLCLKTSNWRTIYIIGHVLSRRFAGKKFCYVIFNISLLLLLLFTNQTEDNYHLSHKIKNNKTFYFQRRFYGATNILNSIIPREKYLFVN